MDTNIVVAIPVALLIDVVDIFVDVDMLLPLSPQHVVYMTCTLAIECTSIRDTI